MAPERALTHITTLHSTLPYYTTTLLYVYTIQLYYSTAAGTRGWWRTSSSVTRFSAVARPSAAAFRSAAALPSAASFCSASVCLSWRGGCGVREGVGGAEGAGGCGRVREGVGGCGGCGMGRERILDHPVQ